MSYRSKTFSDSARFQTSTNARWTTAGVNTLASTSSARFNAAARPASTWRPTQSTAKVSRSDRHDRKPFPIDSLTEVAYKTCQTMSFLRQSYRSFSCVNLFVEKKPKRQSAKTLVSFLAPHAHYWWENSRNMNEWIIELYVVEFESRPWNLRVKSRDVSINSL